MRTRTMILIGALLLVFAGAAQAQQEQPAAGVDDAGGGRRRPARRPPPTPRRSRRSSGPVDFGFRGDSVTGDRPATSASAICAHGGYLDRFRFDKETEDWVFKATANNVGYRDQRYAVELPGHRQAEAQLRLEPDPAVHQRQHARRSTRTTATARLTIDDSIQRSGPERRRADQRRRATPR